MAFVKKTLGSRFRGNDEHLAECLTISLTFTGSRTVQYLALPGVRGNGMTSRTLESPVV